MLYIKIRNGGNKILGEIRENNNGTKMKIIAYRSHDDIDIEFLDDFHYIKEHQAYTNFKTGINKENTRLEK